MMESEARTKWCPMNRVAVFTEESIAYTNRGKQIKTNETTVAQAHGCIGSRCAAWRWDRPLLESELERANTHQGYCGLAGKP